MPRGYGGVAILWDKSIDQMVRAIGDGSERIQFVELSVLPKKLFVISVYMSTRGGSESTAKCQDCVDKVHEIYQKYSQTHDIVIRGDLYEYLSKTDSKTRERIISTTS